MQEKIALYRF